MLTLFCYLLLSVSIPGPSLNVMLFVEVEILEREYVKRTVPVNS